MAQAPRSHKPRESADCGTIDLVDPTMTSESPEAPDSPPIQGLIQAAAVRRLSVNRMLGFFFGILGPALCLSVNSSMPVGVFGEYQLPAFLLIAIEMVMLIVWLVHPARTPWIAAAFSGAFAVGTCFATLVGIDLFPLSVILILAVFGVLGLIPFATAYTFGRLTTDSWRIAGVEKVPRRWLAVLLGAAIAGGPAAAVEGSQFVAVQVAVELLRAPDSEAMDKAQRVLERVPWLDDSLLVQRWDDESDEARRARISELYRRRAGISIEEMKAARVD